jgi:hypothetical protein
MRELNTLQLEHLVSKDKIASKFFKGVYARDKLPKIRTYPACLIFNTDTSREAGQHWCSIYWTSSRLAYYYDPYGMHPETYNMVSYLNKSSRRWMWNSTQDQSIYSTLCGYFSFLFIIFKCRNISVALNDRIIKHYFKL